MIAAAKQFASGCAITMGTLAMSAQETNSKSGQGAVIGLSALELLEWERRRRANRKRVAHITDVQIRAALKRAEDLRNAH